ncbi:MAG TPA: hypothetical protein VMK65_12050 [Longimicrobiales bacterium]|nr:hypothetical protein [Longimicrobiales bacterium]
MPIAMLLVGVACDGNTPTEDARSVSIDDLVFAGSVSQADGEFQGELAISQPAGATQPLRIEFMSTCALALLVHDVGQMAEPRWDQQRWQNEQPGGCKPVENPVDVPATGALTLRTQPADGTSILGDSLLAGAYATAIRIHVTRPADTVLVVPSGVVGISVH